jgi:TldD protein
VCIPASLPIDEWCSQELINFDKLKYLTALFFLVSILAYSPRAAGQAPQEDKLLQILEKELNREYAEFTKVAQPPYFIDYRVNDEESAIITSSFGSLVQSFANRDRSLNVHVRVGDYMIDNTHPREDTRSEMNYPNFEDPSLPLDDNEDAIAVKLWRATQDEYKASLEQYNTVKNILASRKEDKSLADFSKENVEKYYEAPGVKFSEIFNKQQCEEKTRRYSKLFLGDASIVTADVAFRVIRERRYYVSSEGASVVQNFVSAYINISASVRATDGEIVPLHQSYYAPTPSELPSDQVIENDIKNMIVTLQKLKVAPLADPYTGPALLDGPVSGVFFHEIFGHRVEGHRLRSEMDGQTFKSKVDQKILPESISVFCDPTLKQFSGTFLNGNYGYDDEGVKASRVPIVDKGVLRNFLMSRTPLDNFVHSNGHARATGGLSPVSRQSNLFVDAVKTKSTAELKDMLIKECKRQKKEYGYFFKNVVGGFTTTDRFRPNAFNIFPTEVYRIYVDGRPDELVRGVDLIGTPLAMFAEIAGVGNTHGVFTGFCGAESGYVPVSAISPALFVRRIETQKKPKSKVEETVLPAPVSPVNK